MPNLPHLIKQAYQMVMVQNQGPEGGAQLWALVHPVLKPLITDTGGRYQGKGYSVHFSFLFLFSVSESEPWGWPVLMSGSFCEQKDEWGLRIRTKAEWLMTGTALKKKKKIPVDYGHYFVFSREKDIFKNGYDEKCWNTGSCAPISHKSWCLCCT